MAATSTVRLLFLGNASSAVRASRQATAGITGLGKAASTAGKLLAGGVVVGLAMATKAAVDFDKAMRNVNSIARLSETQFKKLEKQVLGLSKVTGQAPKTLAEGMYDIVSSGFDANEALKILNATGKAATAGLTDTATSTKAVVAVLNAYHMGAGKAGEVSDILFQTVNKGVLTFEELASQIGDVLPVAASLGVPLEDVGGALATITLHGVNAAEASTQLKQILVSILKPGRELAPVIEDMGFASGEAAIKTLGLDGVLTELNIRAGGSTAVFQEWFGNIRAGMGVLGLTGKNLVTFKENIEAMQKSQGAASAAFNEQSKSISVQWQKVKATLTAAAIPIGEMMFPLLEKAITKVGEFATKLQGWGPALQSGFGAVGTGLGAVASDIGRIAQQKEAPAIIAGLAAGFVSMRVLTVVGAGLTSFTTGLATMNPLVAIAAGLVGSLAAAYVILSTSVSGASDDLREFEGLLGGVKGATEAVTQSEIVRDAALGRHASALRAIEYGERTKQELEDKGKKGTKEYAAVVDLLRQAHLLERQSKLDVARAGRQLSSDRAKLREETGKLTEEERKARAGMVEFSGALREGGDRANHARDGLKFLNEDIQVAGRAAGLSSKKAVELGDAIEEWGEGAGDKALDKTIRRLSTLFNKLKDGGPQADAARQAIDRELSKMTAEPGAAKVRKQVTDLGRLNPRPKVTVTSNAAAVRAQLESTFSRTINQVVNVLTFRTSKERRAGGGVVGLAGGGIVGGVGSGDTVPAMLTPGEVVLNRGQQGKLAKRLGLPDDPEAIFSAVQRFQSGGIVMPGRERMGGRVGGRIGSRAGRGQKQKPRPRFGIPAKVAEVKDILANVNAIARDISDAQTNYDLVSRELDISEENYLVDNPDGSISLDQAGIGQRLAELDQLLRLKDEMMALLRKELLALQRAVQRLKAAIRALRAEIVRVTKLAEDEAKRAKDHENSTKLLERTLEAMKKDKVDASSRQRINDLKSLIAYHRGEWKSAEGNEKVLKARVDKMKGELPDYVDARDAAAEEARVQPFDMRALELDRMDLRKERRSLTDLKATPAPPEAGGGEGGGLGEGGPGGPGGGDDSAELARLRAMVARLGMALGIERAQLGVIGGFEGFARGGVIRAPTGAPKLALVHGGEMVLNPGQLHRLGGPIAVARAANLPGFQAGGYVGPSVSMPSGGAPSREPPHLQVRVQHNWGEGMSWLRGFVDTRVAAQQIAVARAGEVLRKEGRF